MTLRARLQRVPLLGFFALTFAWPWACWARSPAVKPQLPWLATLRMFGGSFGPSLAAIVMVASTRRVEGLRAWLSRCLQWRIGWGWWAFASLLPLAVMLLAAGLHVALGGDIATAPASRHLRMTVVALSVVFVNGGSALNTNAHLATVDASVPQFREWREWREQSYGAGVLAPCAAPVVLAVGGLPDMQVPEMDHEYMAGNHVLLRCARTDVLLGHLRPGSVQVRAGDAVATGVWLGAVGNSGNTGEPHLHVHAQRPGPVGAPIGGDPLPIMFNGHFLVRGDRIGLP